eukprot:g3464.t1
MASPLRFSSVGTRRISSSLRPRRFLCRPVSSLNLDQPEYDSRKSKIRLEVPSHAYGLSTHQMAALGLVGDQVQRRFDINADSLTSSAHYSGEVVCEQTRIATKMVVGRPADKAPPDLPSLILDGRIVYIGMPLVPSVTELVICELLWLNYDQSDRPIYVYVNSTGSQTPDGKAVGFETEAYAILDTMNYVKPDKYTVALSQAYGNAAMIVASGKQGRRFSMPHSRFKLQAPVMNQSYDISTNATIKANELAHCTDTYVEFMSAFTGRDLETVRHESGRDKYYTPEEAIEYGVIDKIIRTEDEMMLERDYDRMLVQSQAMQRRTSAVRDDSPATGSE